MERLHVDATAVSAVHSLRLTMTQALAMCMKKRRNIPPSNHSNLLSGSADSVEQSAVHCRDS